MRSNAPTQTMRREEVAHLGSREAGLLDGDERAAVVRLERDDDVRGHRLAARVAARRLGDEPVRAVDLEERLRLAEQRVAVRPPHGGLLAADPQVDLDLDDARLLVEDREPDLLLLGVGVGVEDLLGRRGQLPRQCAARWSRSCRCRSSFRSLFLRG